MSTTTAATEPAAPVTTTAPASSQADAGAIAEAETNQIVGFRLADEEYGVDIMRVQEIILMGEITKIPEVPNFIRGLINLRGHVIPIIDLRKRFDLPVRENTEHTRVIVVNVNSKTIGMVVDAVNEVMRINAEQIEPAPASITGIDQSYIRGLVKFEDKLLILLDIETILTSDEQECVANAGANES